MYLRMSVICAMTVLILSAAAYAEPWTMSVDASLTVTQNAYSDNWSGGESGTANWLFLSNSIAEKQLTRRTHNKNVLKLQFGQNLIQDKDSKSWREPEKSNDLIDLESVFRFDLETWLEPFVSGRLESRFIDQNDDDKSVYFNPVTLTGSAGAIKVLVKDDAREWTARIGFGLREHIARQVLDATDGSRSTETATDGGLEFVNDVRTPLARGRVTLTSKLIVFQALFNSESDDLEGLAGEDDWRAPDVNWENVFAVSITRYLNVTLYTQFLYDKEEDKAGRFKQTLGLGLTWKYGEVAQGK